jgi:excisionase family DNA binding protein
VQTLQREQTDRLRTSDVEQRLGVSASTVRRLVADGDLPALRVRRQLRFLPEDVDALLERARSVAA